MKQLIDQARHSQEALVKANDTLDRELRERRNLFKEKEAVWKEQVA